MKSAKSADLLIPFYSIFDALANTVKSSHFMRNYPRAKVSPLSKPIDFDFWSAKLDTACLDLEL